MNRAFASSMQSSVDECAEARVDYSNATSAVRSNSPSTAVTGRVVREVFGDTLDMLRKGTALLAILASGGVMSQPQRDVEPPASERPSASANITAELAARSGIATCLDATQRLGPALSGTSPTVSAVSMSHPVAPSAASFSVSIASSAGAGTQLVNATFAPTLRGSCDLIYESIEIWGRSCETVATETLKQTPPLNKLSRKVLLVEAGPNHHVYLIPTAGDGCVSINKQVLYP
jgi:hypothetical protein